MTKFKNVFSVYLAAVLMLAGFVGAADAQRTNRNERSVRDTVRSLSSTINDFQNSLSNEFRNSRATRRDRNDLEDAVRSMDNKVRDFQTQFNRRSETERDVEAILNDARRADSIIGGLNFSQRTYNQWLEIRNLLGNLANNYNIYWDASDRNNNYPNTRGNQNYYDNDLTGTYRLDTSRSENTEQIIANSRVRDRDREDLREKLDTPEEIAISIRGNQVALASSKASPVTFDANGGTQTQTASNGRTISVRTDLNGDTLTVASLGGDTDFTITFESVENGRTLKVTRRITTDYLRQTVFAESVYTKTDNVARLGINDGGYDNTGGYSSSDPGDYRGNRYPNTRNPRTTGGRSGKFIVPDGTIITGVLENDINTKYSQENDRFTMTVTAPNQYRGAIIEGYISGVDRSGKVSGRSEITFNFVNIRLRNGQTYDFAGNLESITDTDGDTIRVGDEGEARGGSQTKETVKRGGIGAGLGALIGAIVGGGKGAAIGAVIGGSAGAGSVILTGKEDLEIKQGSTVTVQSSSPIR